MGYTPLFCYTEDLMNLNLWFIKSGAERRQQSIPDSVRAAATGSGLSPGGSVEGIALFMNIPAA